MVLQFPHGLVGSQGAQYVENVGCYPIAARLVPRKVGAVKQQHPSVRPFVQCTQRCRASGRPRSDDDHVPDVIGGHSPSAPLVVVPSSREPLWKVVDEGSVEGSTQGRTQGRGDGRHLLSEPLAPSPHLTRGEVPHLAPGTSAGARWAGM